MHRRVNQLARESATPHRASTTYVDHGTGKPATYSTSTVDSVGRGSATSPSKARRSRISRKMNETEAEDEPRPRRSREEQGGGGEQSKSQLEKKGSKERNQESFRTTYFLWSLLGRNLNARVPELSALGLFFVCF